MNNEIKSMSIKTFIYNNNGTIIIIIFFIFNYSFLFN